MNIRPVLNEAVGLKWPAKSLRVSGQKGLEPIVYSVLYQMVSMVTTALWRGHTFCHTRTSAHAYSIFGSMNGPRSDAIIRNGKECQVNFQVSRSSYKAFCGGWNLNLYWRDNILAAGLNVRNSYPLLNSESYVQNTVKWGDVPLIIYHCICIVVQPVFDVTGVFWLVLRFYEIIHVF
jgi:hypothetical protein